MKKTLITLALLLALPAGAVDIRLVEMGTLDPWDQNGTLVNFDPDSQPMPDTSLVYDDIVFGSSVMPKSLRTCQFSAQLHIAQFRRGLPISNSITFPLRGPAVDEGPDGIWNSSTFAGYDDDANAPCGYSIGQSLEGMTVRNRINDAVNATTDPMDYVGPDQMLFTGDDVRPGAQSSLWQEYLGTPSAPVSATVVDPFLDSETVCDCTGSPGPQSNPCFDSSIPGYNPAWAAEVPCVLFQATPGYPTPSYRATNIRLYTQGTACNAAAGAAGVCLNSESVDGHLRTEGYGLGDSKHDWMEGFSIVFQNQHTGTFYPANGVQIALLVPGWHSSGFGTGRSIRVRAYSCSGVELTPAEIGVGGVVDPRYGIGGLVPQWIDPFSVGSFSMSHTLVLTLVDMDHEGVICAVQLDSPDGERFLMSSVTWGDHVATAGDILPDDATRYTDADFVGYMTENVGGTFVSSPTDPTCTGTQDLTVHADVDRDGAHTGDFGCTHQPNNRQHPTGSPPYPLEEPHTPVPTCNVLADFTDPVVFPRTVDATDFNEFLARYSDLNHPDHLRADLNCSGTVDSTDFSDKFLPAFQVGLP